LAGCDQARLMERKRERRIKRLTDGETEWEGRSEKNGARPRCTVRDGRRDSNGESLTEMEWERLPTNQKSETTSSIQQPTKKENMHIYFMCSKILEQNFHTSSKVVIPVSLDKGMIHFVYGWFTNLQISKSVMDLRRWSKHDQPDII